MYHAAIEWHQQTEYYLIRLKTSVAKHTLPLGGYVSPPQTNLKIALVYLQPSKRRDLNKLSHKLDKNSSHQGAQQTLTPKRDSTCVNKKFSMIKNVHKPSYGEHILQTIRYTRITENLELLRIRKKQHHNHKAHTKIEAKQ